MNTGKIVFFCFICIFVLRAESGIVDVAGTYTNPNTEIGVGNTANMTDNTTFWWQTGNCSIPVINNGFRFTLDTGNGNNSVLSGQISGAGPVSIVGRGDLSFESMDASYAGTVANTYSSTTTVKTGWLKLNKTAGVDSIPANLVIGDGSAGPAGVKLLTSDQIADTSILTLYSHATKYGIFRLNGCNETIGGLNNTNGTDSAYVENNHDSLDCTLTISNSLDLAYSGTIRNGSTGALKITKAGTGTWYFNGTAPDAGLWTLSGGTLGGTGTISGAVTVESGAAISPGTNTSVVGTLVINNNLTLNSGSILRFDLGQPGVIGSGTNDLVTGVNNLDLNGTLNVTASSGFAFGTYRLINYTGTLSGGGLNIGSKPNHFQVVVSTSTVGQVDLIVDREESGTMFFVY